MGQKGRVEIRFQGIKEKLERERKQNMSHVFKNISKKEIELWLERTKI